MPVRSRTLLRSSLLVLVAPALLAGCGDDPKPKAPPVGQECQTQGTIEAEPVPTIREAVQPYLEPGHKIRIAEKFSDTATVQLRGDDSNVRPAEITLVRTGEGWVTTGIARC